MDRALRFYRDTFDLDVVQHTPGWSMLRFCGSTIALHITGGSDVICRNAGINFQVDDLDAAIEEVLTSGGEHIVTREPDDFVPVRMCELKDTEGNAIELRQFVGPPPDLSAIGP
jgi:predicted enzyme related to lactoylglutathione lyase